jgi:D-threo-aldose 1-dehydrogenase
VVPEATKRGIVENWLKSQPRPVIDSAGKYGAGLALENIGRYLKQLGAAPDQVLLSNKLGWKRVPLTTPEPTFEKGAWFGLEHDAAQHISYQGILECYHQGNDLLGDYSAQLVSVHDPDEYLAASKDPEEAARRYEDILGAYRALVELREQGSVQAVGVGSKDWNIIQRLVHDGASLDWVMLANSFTLYTHPVEVLDFLAELQRAGITIINSAVFNAGFLIGGKYFDYAVITETSHPEAFAWRERFLALCSGHAVTPAHACCQFGLSAPGIAALALNTSNPENVARNTAMTQTPLPPEFWQALKDASLLNQDYPYL